MTAVVGHCPSCNRSGLVEVREWHIYNSIIPELPSPWFRYDDCCVYADCPHCGGDIDQYEGAT